VLQGCVLNRCFGKCGALAGLIAKSSNPFFKLFILPFGFLNLFVLFKILKAF